jgi:hypothetical protein
LDHGSLVRLEVSERHGLIGGFLGFLDERLNVLVVRHQVLPSQGLGMTVTTFQ